ncbi:hypothetical protein FHR83_004601 [Actinoplanes campanulatus]|uniref:Uncharacterized protein n=1 Tax=Actinoplanes campanulatus TaxID=113559 RepID=A0A7W5FG03_9ACTN|nr:hypothetical protein [Actinoplanes campanulatus]MBB3096927.1 hypothetical protein [Actinoplanes campanulatus]GGN44926.1 hypothetical protein GCM10010109_78590 [Actinoplanes campanulatus]GID37470.1 hypothetical protein Aca09nite_39760 [Actinoplanes campanulatus]
MPQWEALLAAGDPVPALAPKHEIDLTVQTILQLVFAVGWSAIYLMAIRRGFKDGRLGIPLLALAGNIGWETMFTWVFPVDRANWTINVFWFAIDLVIVYQAIRFGRRDFPGVAPAVYRWSVAGLFAFGFGFMYALPHDLGGDFLYPALLLDCFLSYAFIWMLLRRGSTDGQTMYIAVLKLVANAAATVLAIANYPDRLLFPVLFATTVVLDILYIVMLHRAFVKEGRPVWRTV